MLKKVYKIFPVHIIYDDKIPELLSFTKDQDFAGITMGNKIYIKNQYKDDRGLLEHELVHVKQYIKRFPFHSWLYTNWNWYRCRSEVSAYKKQLKINKEDGKENYIELYSDFILTKYDIKNYSKEEIYNKLK